MDNIDRNLVLEDLLKIKKHEKPDQAFWDQFEQQLREKTLQELVYRPSFFSRISGLLTISLFKPILSATALAVLTIALFTYSNNTSFYSQKTSVIAKNIVSLNDENLISHSSAKRNYIKNTIITQSEGDCNYANMHVSPTSSSEGIRYLAGNLAFANPVNIGNSMVY